MRNSDRIDILLRKIKDIWSKNPDLRLGQLILNVVPETYLYYIEDEELLKALLKGYEKFK